ncbi:phosphoribosylaminoimidazole carboxylase, ATPase subunit [Synechococcus sp. PCC 7335]|uniref:5-(carboxyamino)imidazole ribonucleotide synthase n=1 Tax=Synechococcus sp. (strain ATCC 29403 / PCC 7335) TaxID=91464 RepID=UPI00017ED59D|nr:5-(carboxyamino)imidazole ribonucleotide synthase [Synechococcus sp. PCC 7335]EDX86271.1 phosphoribosylaminoimidazole carboxylase, ATPase subunit [Synechococcus sp. PCC 7335]
MTDEYQQVNRVGVIGGGQLAWMMAAGARALNIALHVQTPSNEDPAVKIAQTALIGEVDDAAVTAQLAKQCDVITFENEFIDLSALRQIEGQIYKAETLFAPSLDALSPLLDKYEQRLYCDRLNLPSLPFTTLESKTELSSLAEKVASLGLPLVLKTRRHGYDGQGTFILKTLADVEATWEKLGYQPVLLEAFVEFEKELAVMVARSASGEVAVYPVVETEQIDQVCRRVIVPARVGPEIDDQVRAIATTLITHLDFVGVLGIELFLSAQGKVTINEVAPRTHNSGHYTLDACITSQFEQQLRAVSNRPLGSTDLKKLGAIMVNLLGTDSTTSGYQNQCKALSEIPDAHVYWYGKKRSRLGRKMGHVTILTDSPSDDKAIAETIKAVEELWYRS